jgi:hypothetical protein
VEVYPSLTIKHMKRMLSERCLPDNIKDKILFKKKEHRHGMEIPGHYLLLARYILPQADLTNHQGEAVARQGLEGTGGESGATAAYI